MSKTLLSILTFSLGFLVLVFYTACQGVQKQNTSAPNNVVTAVPSEQGEVLPPPAIDDAILARLKTERWSGDLNGLIERRYIRALVLYKKTNFFYDGPQPRGDRTCRSDQFKKSKVEKRITPELAGVTTKQVAANPRDEIAHE